jgi:glycerophosphoryl diester phosphodiesterase
MMPPEYYQQRLYAHRGAPAELPENTLESFQRALDIGVDAIETDVHMTADGHIILSHDPSALRMTGVTVRWSDISLTDTQRFDAGWGFIAADGSRPFSGQGNKVATFEAALVMFPDTVFNVDLKQHSPSMVGRMIALIGKHDAEHRVTLASFQLATLLKIRRQGYRGDTAMSQLEVAAFIATPLPVWKRLPYTASCVQVPVAAGPRWSGQANAWERGALRFDTRWFIDKCHAAGMRVDFWTINDQRECDRLLALGADGIMTDDPARVRRI